MAKTHPFIKGLAETRARAAGDIERCQTIGSALAAKLAKAQVAVEQYQSRICTVSARLAAAQTEVSACDLFLQKKLPDLTPSAIPCVHAWQGRYGARGALTRAIVSLLRGCAPDETGTPDIARALQLQFNLEFPTKDAHLRWVHGTVGKKLKLLVRRGLVERLGTRSRGPRMPAYWRWKKQQATTMGELRAMAAAAGIGTVQADDIPDGAQEGAAEGVEA